MMRVTKFRSPDRVYFLTLSSRADHPGVGKMRFNLHDDSCTTANVIASDVCSHDHSRSLPQALSGFLWVPRPLPPHRKSQHRNGRVWPSLNAHPRETGFEFKPNTQALRGTGITTDRRFHSRSFTPFNGVPTASIPMEPSKETWSSPKRRRSTAKSGRFDYALA